MRIRELITSIVAAGAIGVLALVTLYVLPLQSGAVYSVGMAVTWITGDYIRRSSLRATRPSPARSRARRKLKGMLWPEPWIARGALLPLSTTEDPASEDLADSA